MRGSAYVPLTEAWGNAGAPAKVRAESAVAMDTNPLRRKLLQDKDAMIRMSEASTVRLQANLTLYFK